jgi:lipoprotein NlpD
MGDKVVNETQKDSSTRSGIAWRWPAVGRFAKADAVSGKKGLEILGAPGQAVNAAADGLVVYSGNGLGDYGQLIIVKHNNSYLSAYAHNSKLVATEGARVRAGQKIAEMGGLNGQDVKLYFEIRRNGKPVNPLTYLPQK